MGLITNEKFCHSIEGIICQSHKFECFIFDIVHMLHSENTRGEYQQNSSRVVAVKNNYSLKRFCCRGRASQFNTWSILLYRHLLPPLRHGAGNKLGHSNTLDPLPVFHLVE